MPDNVNSSRLYWPELLYFFEYTTAGTAAKKWRSLWVRQSGARLCIFRPIVFTVSSASGTQIPTGREHGSSVIVNVFGCAVE
jgi:hypothetical protein